MTHERKMFGVIRHNCDSGKEWATISELGYDRGDAEMHANESNKKCGPLWADANPVRRIVPVTVTIAEGQHDL